VLGGLAVEDISAAMVFSQPLYPLLLAGHDQGCYWPLCVRAADLSSTQGVRIGLLLRAVTIRNVAFHASLSSPFLSGSPASSTTDHSTV